MSFSQSAKRVLSERPSQAVLARSLFYQAVEEIEARREAEFEEWRASTMAAGSLGGLDGQPAAVVDTQTGEGGNTETPAEREG